MAISHTKLEAVNVLLSNIGQVPVTSLDRPNPAVQLAEGILEEVNHAVQQEGWVFNTECSSDGCITLPVETGCDYQNRPY